jgi:glycerol-3-phosphate dehydrogenase (NAD(P)+)
VESIRHDRENLAFLPGFRLPEDLTVTGDLQQALHDADFVVVAVPSQHVRRVAMAARPFVPGDALVLSVVKGIELGSGRRMTEVLAEVLGDLEPTAVGLMSGPNLAREVMAGHPSATCVAFPSPEPAQAAQRLFMGDTLRVYTSDDVVGCEIGGAVKNVLAIAAGVADGLGYGMNTKAALITRGLAELTRFGVALGGHPGTFVGLTGNGDLIATCASPHSRNRRVGEELATGSSIAQIVGDIRTVAEGVETAPAVLDIARRLGVDMPITETVVALLRGTIVPHDVVPRLMRRDPKAELEGLDG